MINWQLKVAVEDDRPVTYISLSGIKPIEGPGVSSPRQGVGLAEYAQQRRYRRAWRICIWG